MTDQIREYLYLEYFSPSPYNNEEGTWESLVTWDAIINSEEAKRQARHYSDIYKKVRLLKRTVTKTAVEEEVDFSE